MIERLQSSWELVKASAAVLRSDKELLLFPVVSAIGTIVVTAAFLVPMFASHALDGWRADGQMGPVAFVVAFLFYVVQYTVIFFANTALVGAATIRLRGGDPTVADGFRIAFRHLGSIIGYAVIAATVGMILRALSRRSGLIGRIILGLVGMAWNLATFLVVPVLAVEGVGPIEAIQRSAALLKKTWGEQIAGNLGIGLVFGLASLLLCVILAPLVFLAVATGEATLIVLTIGVGLVLLVALGLINATLSGIYAAAVYNYAADGRAGGMFEEALVKQAFRTR